jgi:hypothetical protein
MIFLSTFADNLENESLFSVKFTEEELRKCGVDKDSVEFDEEYIGKHELHKLSRLWTDPYYLANFYEKNKPLFEVKYWKNISPEKFAMDVTKSSPLIFKQLQTLAKTNSLDSYFEPLDLKRDVKQPGIRISRAKAKFGYVINKRVFRIYAIKIDSNCYLITGGAIKITLDMNDALHTKTELKKIDFVYNNTSSKDIFDKTSFIDLIL